MAKSRRSTRAACLVLSCCSAASTLQKPVQSRCSRATTRWCSSRSICSISTVTICAAFRWWNASACSRKSSQPGDGINYSNHFEGNGAELLAAAKQQGLEGIVGKRANSFYESRRGSDWVKYKVTASSSFVLCGFTKGERDYFGALVLGDLR